MSTVSAATLIQDVTDRMKAFINNCGYPDPLKGKRQEHFPFVVDDEPAGEMMLPQIVVRFLSSEGINHGRIHSYEEIGIEVKYITDQRKPCRDMASYINDKIHNAQTTFDSYGMFRALNHKSEGPILKGYERDRTYTQTCVFRYHWQHHQNS